MLVNPSDRGTQLAVSQNRDFFFSLQQPKASLTRSHRCHITETITITTCTKEYVCITLFCYVFYVFMSVSRRLCVVSLGFIAQVVCRCKLLGFMFSDASGHQNEYFTKLKGKISNLPRLFSLHMLQKLCKTTTCPIEPSRKAKFREHVHICAVGCCVYE